MSLPAMLDRLKLNAFDLGKMITLYVRNQPTLPREMKRQLFLVEEQILESAAWGPGSSLLQLMSLLFDKPQLLGADSMAGPGAEQLPPVSPKRAVTSSSASPCKKCEEDWAGIQELGRVGWVTPHMRMAPLFVGTSPAYLQAAVRQVEGCVRALGKESAVQLFTGWATAR